MTKPMTTSALTPIPLDRSTEASRAATGLASKAGGHSLDTIGLGIDRGCDPLLRDLLGWRAPAPAARYGLQTPVAVFLNERLLVAAGHSNAAVPASADPSHWAICYRMSEKGQGSGATVSQAGSLRANRRGRTGSELNG